MKKIFGALVAAVVLAFSANVQADVFFSGDTTGGPVFNRPSSSTTLSGVGTATPYVVVPFYVDLSGAYVFEVDASSPETHTDPYALVYTGSFDPLNALTNLVDGDDDFSGAFTILSGSSASGLDASRIGAGETSNFSGGAGLNLIAGVQYYAVITGFGNTDQGTFRAAIGDGPGRGNVFLGTVGIPEPATAGLLIGMSLVGLVVRRRK